MENKTYTILIVDDVASNIQIMANILKNSYDIKVSIDGLKALDIASQSPQPDLILLDVGMPVMDGYEVIKRLKNSAITQDIPVIFVTGKDTTDDEQKGFELGAVDYITKPVIPAIVRARVKAHITIKSQRDQLIYNASHDQLTGLHNRSMLNQEAPRKFARAKRHDDLLSVIMCDIDHFKSINDKYGHLFGDKVLIEVGKIFSQFHRSEDFCARFGGEEFIIILENCNLDNAVNIAQKLRVKIEQTLVEGIKISASFGVAQIGANQTSFEELVKCADEALYKAKENGRNRVESYEIIIDV